MNIPQNTPPLLQGPTQAQWNGWGNDVFTSLMRTMESAMPFVIALGVIGLICWLTWYLLFKVV